DTAVGPRGAQVAERSAELAAELARLKVDVIVTGGNAALAAKQASSRRTAAKRRRFIMSAMRWAWRKDVSCHPRRRIWCPIRARSAGSPAALVPHFGCCVQISQQVAGN